MAAGGGDDISVTTVAPTPLSEFEHETTLAVQLQSQLDALRRRVEELERENRELCSRISACSRCSKKMNKMFLDHQSSRKSGSIEKNSDQDDKVGGGTIDVSNGRLRGSMQEYHKRYVALKIMYFGQRFYGFASEAHTDPTIESEIFKALAKTKLAIGSKEELNYSRCGRTDKGVSSSGQVIALYLRSAPKNSDARGERQEEIDYVNVLNRVLPNDIRVMGWSHVPAVFHARFSCLRREYKYFFWRDKMDIVAMQDAGKRFIGEHDFRNFCKMDALNVSNYMRRITTFEVCSCSERRGDDELYAVIIGGSAFLWHQVRCMVALLFMIGQGLESPMIIDLLLDTSKFPRKPQYNMAPELPLVLRSCEFEELIFHCSSDAKRALVDNLTSTIQAYLVQAAIYQEALDSVTVSGQSKKKRPHIPLLRRPTEPSYEERRAKLEIKNNGA